ncbi:DUF5658 family protein [Rhodopirellula sp. SWK7]|uniref:DUF5658 family protein n=1 Tax=Rhodopirellula sp. SWK7 TaxID=595460 RepID=UPI0007C5C71C|nr:DUF5658 family protein [Rhodopirellula sp. SWK7]
MKITQTPRWFNGRVLASLLLFVLGASASQAQRGRYGREDVAMGRPIETEQGFLFVDGAFVAPPYKIEFEEDSIRINGEDYAADAFDLSRYSPRSRGMRGEGPRSMGYRGGGSFHRGEPQETVEYNPLWRLSREFSWLSHGAIFVLKQENPPLILWPTQHGFDLLETLIATAEQPVNENHVHDAVTSDEDRETWRDLVANFQATPAFLSKATKLVDEMNAVEIDAERQHAAQRLGEKVSYPLTMFALVLVVIAVGHLLTHAQATNLQIDDPSTRETIKKSTVVSLIIVGLMSAIDLVWTLVAHQSGTMREMNPLGSRLIADPVQLIAFKIVITSMSIGLLFWLRDLPFARRATWWCCLVLTLLTVRWVTFQSLFV